MSGKVHFSFAVVASIILAAASPNLSAQAAASFNLPAQPLAESLKAVGLLTKINVLVTPDLIDGRQAPALKAQLTASEAIARLLEGTGLRHRFVNEHTVVLASATDLSLSSGTIFPSPTAGQEMEEAPNGSPRNWIQVAQADTAQSDPSARSDSASTESKAAPALEEIVVTAEKREESIQSLPIAISAFSGETLTERGIGGLEQLSQLAPSTQVNIIPGLVVSISVRGISNEIRHTEPSVAWSRDGVSYGVDQLPLGGDFFDVERVEVLRGPQGTISGRNATAGAIHIHSNRPTDEFERGIKATLGNYNRVGLEGYLSGPIVGERLLGRLAVRTDQADGWVTNTLRDQELGTTDKAQARGSLLARVTDNFEALLILDNYRDRSDPLSPVYVDDGRLRPDTPTLTEAFGIPSFDWKRNNVQLSDLYNMDIEQSQATLRLAWEVGPSAKLTAITGYVEQDATAVSDPDGTEEVISNFGEPGEVFTNTKQVSQEVTLTADLTDRLDLILGALYLDASKQHPFIFALPPVGLTFDAQDDFNLTSWAGYTQWRYRLTDEIRLTAGARYTHDSKDSRRRISLNGVPLPDSGGDGTWNAWTPRFAVDYAPSDDLMLYASVSRGFKSGGNLVGLPFDPEYVWNYETGVKTNWLGGRLKTTLTGFYMDYTDLQQMLEIFDRDLNVFVAGITNAESATNTGVELEFDALITDRLRFTFAGTWLDATYDELQQPDPLFPELGAPLPEAPDGPNFRDLSGNREVRAPEWQFNVSGEYRTPLGPHFLGGNLQGVLRASYAWQDRVFYDIFNNQSSTSQGAYGLINLFGAIETADARWQLSAFVHNLADEHYYMQNGVSIGVAPVPYSSAFIGAPRRYGLSLAYRF